MKKNFKIETDSLPVFKEDKYGQWPEEFLSEETDEQDIINGLEVTGCPFAFVIDQINDFIL